MNINEFQKIYEYLKHKKYPQNIQKKNTKERFENKVKKYLLINNQLYYEKGEKKLKVIKRFELELILYMMYDDLIAGYFAIEIMYNKIKERYYWPKMYEDIKIYPYKKGMLGKCHQNVWIYLNMSGKCPKK